MFSFNLLERYGHAVTFFIGMEYGQLLCLCLIMIKDIINFSSARHGNK